MSTSPTLSELRRRAREFQKHEFYRRSMCQVQKHVAVELENREFQFCDHRFAVSEKLKDDGTSEAMFSRLELARSTSDQSLHKRVCQSFSRQCEGTISKPGISARQFWVIPYSPTTNDPRNGKRKRRKPPLQSTGTKTVNVTIGPNSVYCLQLFGDGWRGAINPRRSLAKNLCVFKIGHTNNDNRRLKEINKPLPDTSWIRYELFDKKKFGSSEDAQRAEQNLLKSLPDEFFWFEHNDEIVVCSKVTLETNWRAKILPKDSL